MAHKSKGWQIKYTVYRKEIPDVYVDSKVFPSKKEIANHIENALNYESSGVDQWTHRLWRNSHCTIIKAR